MSFCARDALEQCTSFPVVAAAASSAGTAVTLSVASAAAAAAFVTAVVPACAVVIELVALGGRAALDLPLITLKAYDD